MLAMAAVAACGLSACGDRPAAPAADSLTSAGTPIELERTDSDYLSEPLAFTTGASSTFVSDAASGTVLEYASGGAFVRRIGARGNGPGQFVGPTALAVVGDTALLVADAALRRINVFSLDAGVARGAYRVEAQAANLAVRTDTIVMGMQDLAQSTSAGILILGDSMVRRIGALPKTLRAFPRIAENYPLSYAVMSGDVIRVAFMGSDQLYTIDTRGALRDSIRLPARHRIGVPNDLDVDWRIRRREAAKRRRRPSCRLSVRWPINRPCWCTWILRCRTVPWVPARGCRASTRPDVSRAMMSPCQSLQMPARCLHCAAIHCWCCNIGRAR